jgi:putative membrane protein
VNEVAEPSLPPRGRLHPLAIVVFARRMVGASILPVVVVAFTWRPTFVVPGLLALAGVGAVLVVLEWRRFTYRIESGRLVIERGVFRHTTRVVPLDRIRGVELQAPWLHRVLGLVRVDVEAASGGSEAAELTLAAVAAGEGERLRRVLLAGARPAASAKPETEPPLARVLFHAGPRLLVVGGLTSGRHILAPLVVVGVVTNFADDLPGGFLERLVSSAADRAPTDALGVSLLVVVALVLTAVLAASGSLLADWEFELSDDGERLHARRGLLTSRAVVIDRARVRGIDLRDSPLRRAFDLVGVHAIAGGIGGGRSGRTMLAPVIRREEARGLLSELDPETSLDTPLERHPTAARTRRIVRAVSVPLVFAAWALVIGWPWPAGLLLALAIAGVPLGIDRYRQLGHSYDGRRLAVREGSLTRRWTSLDPGGVISYAVERSPFQARVGLCTIVLHLGQGAGTRRVLDCSEEQAATLLASLDAPLLGPFVREATPSGSTA